MASFRNSKRRWEKLREKGHKEEATRIPVKGGVCALTEGSLTSAWGGGEVAEEADSKIWSHLYGG